MPQGSLPIGTAQSRDMDFSYLPPNSEIIRPPATPEPPLSGLPCPERPELLINMAIGMYHCPLCGMMVRGGLWHPIVSSSWDPESYAAIAAHMHFTNAVNLGLWPRRKV